MTNVLNTKVLLSAGVIVAMAAAALGATYAAWSASDDITGNTISTANLSITAEGLAGGSGTTVPLPFNATNTLPGFISSPEERAVVTNTSSVPLNLYMYYDSVSGSACPMTKIAWQSAILNTGPVLAGYPAGTPPTVAGASTDTPAFTGDLTLISVNSGYAGKVLVASSTNFEPDEAISMRQVAAFATDAQYPTHAGNCQWTLWFVGETV